jgi:hypothetical protein
MTRETTLMSAAYGLSTLVGVVIQIVLLVVTLTVIRRNRPSAVAPLAASFAVGLLSTAGAVVVYPLVSYASVNMSGGFDRFALFQAATTVGFTLLHAIAGVLLVLGLVRLATPDPIRAEA